MGWKGLLKLDLKLRLTPHQTTNHFIYIRIKFNSQFIYRPRRNPSPLIEALIIMLQIFFWSVELPWNKYFLNSQYPLLLRQKTPQCLTALRGITVICRGTLTLSKALFNSHDLHPTLTKGFWKLPISTEHYYSWGITLG